MVTDFNNSLPWCWPYVEMDVQIVDTYGNAILAC